MKKEKTCRIDPTQTREESRLSVKGSLHTHSRTCLRYQDVCLPCSHSFELALSYGIHLVCKKIPRNKQMGWHVNLKDAAYLVCE